MSTPRASKSFTQSTCEREACPDCGIPAKAVFGNNTGKFCYLQSMRTRPVRHFPKEKKNETFNNCHRKSHCGVPNRQGTYTVIPSKTWGPGQFGAVAGGCYIMDAIDACLPLIDFNGGGGQYQSCIAAVTSDLKQQGELSRSEAAAINSCATTVVPLINP